MSRTQANKTFEWKKVNAFLREKGVTLILAGLDEVPMVYKNIHEVIAAQNDLDNPGPIRSEAGQDGATWRAGRD